MADEIIVKVPDIGGASHVDVIELLAQAGDEVNVDTPLMTLESEKASMDIPSPLAGKIAKWLIKVGDKVSEGDAILTLLGVPDQAVVEKEKTAVAESSMQTKQADKEQEVAVTQKTRQLSETKEVFIPDIGGATDVDVIEIMVSAGDVVKKDQPLITLEGDKATMDIPSPYDGKVEKVSVNTGDKVSQGHLILVMKLDNPPVEADVSEPAPAPLAVQHTSAVSQSTSVIEQNKPESEVLPLVNAAVSAGPSVRRMARELGVNLNEVQGSGRKKRILKEDIDNYVKRKLSEKSSGAGFALPQAPAIDFSKFGSTEIKPLNKIKRLTGVNVHRAWVTIPHVTQFDEADITDLEAFRKQEAPQAIDAGYKLTILAFVTKAVTRALIQFPQFNASLDASGENLVYKKYFNVGIAVETPNGLVVPVIKQVDQLSVAEIASEMAVISKKARDKALTPADMSGGCFTISSLGGIGGTAFTPIVNSPEVAILGLSRSSIKPVYQQGEFKPRLMLPLSLSYDHRVIDGAEAARFTGYIADLLSDIRRILL